VPLLLRGTASLSLWPEAKLLAQQATEFMEGGPMPDIAPQQMRYEGKLWRSLMARWTNQATIGTKVVPPNTEVTHGQVFQFGDVTLKMHFYGMAHTSTDLCMQVVQDKVTAVGDTAMAKRIANIDDGSYPGTFKYFKEIAANAGDQLWLPGQNHAGL
jgi:glyoxylase-like metal-dependent hydrolase (beta-lactamase superfamily II)